MHSNNIPSYLLVCSWDHHLDMRSTARLHHDLTLANLPGLAGPSRLTALLSVVWACTHPLQSFWLLLVS